MVARSKEIHSVSSVGQARHRQRAAAVSLRSRSSAHEHTRSPAQILRLEVCFLSPHLSTPVSFSVKKRACPHCISFSRVFSTCRTQAAIGDKVVFIFFIWDQPIGAMIILDARACGFLGSSQKWQSVALYTHAHAIRTQFPNTVDINGAHAPAVPYS